MLNDAPMLLDTSEEQKVYLIQGENGAYIRLSPSAYQLYAWMKEGKDTEEIAALLEAEGRGRVPGEQVAEACALVKDRVRNIETRKLSPGRGFLFHLPILRAAWVARLSRPLTGLFHPWVVVTSLALIAACYGAVWAGYFPAHTAPAKGGLAFGLIFLSLLVHELGHASACSRYGEPPSQIGLTLYLIFPAFYADVTGAWRLRRWQRVVVDLGGIYFQTLMGGVYALLFMVTGSPTLRLVVWLMVGSILFQLNPIFRFDGYWLIADGLGVSNLGAQPRRLLRHLIERLRGRPVQPLPWPTWILAVLGLYAVASAIVWTWFYWRVWPALRFYLVKYPATLHTLWTSGMHQIGLAKALSTTLLSAIPLAFLVYFLARSVSPLRKGLRWLAAALKKAPRPSPST